jgi:glucose/arabinose dehydrogenase
MVRRYPFHTEEKIMQLSRVMSLSMLATCSTVLVDVSGHAAVLPTGFREIAVTNVISSPTAMDFSPDGKLFVLRQTGQIEVYSGSGHSLWTRLQANFLLNVPISVDSFFERGMLGIAFDPDYLNNRFVYLYYTSATPPVHNRIIRVTANETGDLALAGSLTPLMELENLSAGNHNGGAIHFGIDGKLYVGVGENANGNNSQSINNRLGKMLRLNPDPKDPIPSDNPTSISGITGTPMGNNRAIWAAGLRNPFTFAINPVNGEIFINDVGAGSWEEINRGMAGANYGWPQTEGPFNQTSFPFFTRPISYYERVGGLNSFPPLAGYAGNTITGGAFYVPANPTFPADYVGDYFFSDHGAGWIKRFDPAAVSIHNFATGAGSPVGMALGSDSALYYLSRGNGRVFRVQYTCAADVNVSGGVDADDVIAVILGWGACPAPPTVCADANASGTVDADDLNAVVLAWGDCP